MSIVLMNPNAANRTVTTFVSGRDENGFEVHAPSNVESFRADAAITKGQAVMFVFPTATVPVSVTPMSTAGDDRLFVGAALDNYAIGEQCLIATAGLCLVRVVDDTPAAGDVLFISDTTVGSFETVVTDPAATVTVGNSAGVVLGTKGADNLCLAYLRVV